RRLLRELAVGADRNRHPGTRVGEVESDSAVVGLGVDAVRAGGLVGGERRSSGDPIVVAAYLAGVGAAGGDRAAPAGAGCDERDSDPGELAGQRAAVAVCELDVEVGLERLADLGGLRAAGYEDELVWRVRAGTRRRFRRRPGRARAGRCDQ